MYILFVCLVAWFLATLDILRAPWGIWGAVDQTQVDYVQGKHPTYCAVTVALHNSHWISSLNPPQHFEVDIARVILLTPREFKSLALDNMQDKHKGRATLTYVIYF